MAVTITKPAFNVRDKIAELDHDKIPYHKFPIGSVIQTQYYEHTGSGATNESETSSTSYQPTLFNVTITPKFRNSLILLMASPNIKSSGSSGYHTLGFYYALSGGSSYSAVHSSGATHGLTNWRFNGESLWYANATLIQIHKPNTLESINYKIYHRNTAGSYTVRVGENGADEYMIAQEIKQ